MKQCFTARPAATAKPAAAPAAITAGAAAAPAATIAAAATAVSHPDSGWPVREVSATPVS